jgi:hypothetical protein
MRDSNPTEDKLNAIVDMINGLNARYGQLEQRVMAIERQNQQFDDKLRASIADSQVAYQDTTRHILSSLETMQRSFLVEVRSNHEMLASVMSPIRRKSTDAFKELKDLNAFRPEPFRPDFRTDTFRPSDSSNASFRPEFRASDTLNFGSEMDFRNSHALLNFSAFKNDKNVTLEKEIKLDDELKMLPELQEQVDEVQFGGPITDEEFYNPSVKLNFKDLMKKDEKEKNVSPSVPVKRTTSSPEQKSETAFITLYYDVGVYVPYSTLRKQLRRHGVQSSLILNMYYRRGGIVEIVTYQSSAELLVHDLDKLPQWKRVEKYEPVIGSLELKEDTDKENVTDANSLAMNITSAKEATNVICAYLTSVHAAILTSNGSESLKNYYKTNALENCARFIKSLNISGDWRLEEMWASTA